MNIRKDDLVVVITGDDADNKRSHKVLRVLTDKQKVLVEGVNRVYKHLKPNRRNAQGGRLSKEMPISVSNVMLYCATCRRGVRVGHRFNEAGQKERICKKCKNSLSNIGLPSEAHAKKA
jgi:large subunit ribosomal protein L24